MKPNDLLNQFDDAAIVSAIAAAETRTTGEIRVFISRKSPDDVAARARRRFRLLRMHRTTDRNAVLLYLAPRVQKFAIIGDEGIHRLCGQEFWNNAAKILEDGLRSRQFTTAVTDTIAAIGAALALHFPEMGAVREKMPDEVLRD